MSTTVVRMVCNPESRQEVDGHRRDDVVVRADEQGGGSAAGSRP